MMRWPSVVSPSSRSHFAEGYWGINEGRQLFRRVVASKPHPTAIICGNAYLTVGALLESQAMGFRVPERDVDRRL